MIISGNNARTVFYLLNARLELNGITISNATNTTGQGGGIYNDGGIVTVANSIISNNRAFQGGGVYNCGNMTLSNTIVTGNTAAGGRGGGIYNGCTTAMMTITNSIISDNTATSSGGGIYNFGLMTMTISGSTIRNNKVSSTASGSAGGAGIFNFGAMSVSNSIISGNTTQSGGGGIHNYSNIGIAATLTLVNSTISGNIARSGGGIYNQIISGQLTSNLTNVTVTKNHSTRTASCQLSFTSCVGGIDGGATNLNNTIVAGNTASGNSSDTYFAVDVLGGVSSGSSYNFIGNNKGITGIANGTNGNQVGTPTNPIDPGLTPLGNNGGTTQTHALLSDSPVIDKGKSFGATTDQRGNPRPIDNPSIPNAAGGDAADIGAFEAGNNLTISSKILFTRLDGNIEVYSMNQDGSNEIRITNTPYNESFPRWSPDSRKIVYYGNQDGSTTQIYTMNSDGSNVVRLTNSNTHDRLPDWSPDGMKILFERCNPADFRCDIWTMNADGSGQTNLTQTSVMDETQPRWSPDGTKIVFIRADDVVNPTFADVFTIDLILNKVVAITVL